MIELEVLSPSVGVRWWSVTPRAWTDPGGTWVDRGATTQFFTGFFPMLGAMDGDRPLLWDGLVAVGPQPTPGPDAHHARRRPALSGGAWFWWDDGVWWRWRDGRSTAVAIGHTLWPGPDGSAVLVDENSEMGPIVIAIASPDGPAVPLDRPLVLDAWGLRFVGDALFGLDDGCAPARVDRRGRVVAAEPIVAEGVSWSEHSLVGAGAPRLVHGTPARRGPLLAGPGGVVWDLRTGRPCFERPVVRRGVTVPGATSWLTLDRDNGEGVWFAPGTGEVHEPAVIPLDPDDALDDALPVDDGALVMTLDGAAWLLRPGAAPERASPRPVPWTPRVAWGPLLLHDELTVDGRVYGWRDDGLLVRRPR
jgi:hypothetical protein